MRLIAIFLAVAAAAAPLPAAHAPRIAEDGPAARRLNELMAAVASGDRERIRTYVREAYSPELRKQNPEERVVQAYMALFDRTRGFDVESFRVTPTEAAVLLRSRLTGALEPLSVRVEPDPPHRLVGPASIVLGRPKHPLSSPAATDAERVREIDRIARKLAGVEAFSGTVLIARGDRVLYLGTFGAADKEARLPIRRTTRYNLASITKTFTTVAIAQLVEKGKLSWEDPLGTFFPDFPLAEAREKVRIKHLVTHTSGLRDTLRYCEQNRCPETYESLDAYVRVAGDAQEEALLFEPGTRYAYTNSTFSLLAAIVERLTGTPFYSYIRTNVFRPSGMRDTGYTERDQRPPRLAVGYEKQSTEAGARFSGEASRRERARSYPAPFCCAHSTATDLLRYAQALRSGRILRPETTRILFSPKAEAGTWGYGFDILDEERGIIGHSGSWIGMSNSVDLFTASGYTAIILSNYTNGRSPLRETIWSILP